MSVGTRESCTCPECVRCCTRRPCWPTPEEAEALIAAGYGPRLMRDWWVGGWHVDDELDIHLLSPAVVGYEGGYAPEFPRWRCTFLTDANLCELHDAGLKPTEGREVLGCGTDVAGLHKRMAETWNNAAAASLVEEWTVQP